MPLTTARKPKTKGKIKMKLEIVDLEIQVDQPTNSTLFCTPVCTPVGGTCGPPTTGIAPDREDETDFKGLDILLEQLEEV